MPVKQFQYANSSQRWATNNPKPQSKPTTVPHLESSTTTSNPVAPKRWTCVSIGSVAAKPNNNSNSIGALANTTEPIIGPSITAPLITPNGAKTFSPPNSSWTPFALPPTAHQPSQAKAHSRSIPQPPLRDLYTSHIRGHERVC